jgi:sphingomyelin phosphodiesterase
LQAIHDSAFYAGNTCGACQAGLQVAKFVALANPALGPTLAVRACEQFNYSKTCGTSYGPRGLGPVITQVVANADVGGYDGQMLCQNFLGLCPLPPTSPLNLTGWFAKPKPNPLPAPKKPSGVRIPVLHLSDVHLDPRYATGSEANCTSGTCCRKNNAAGLEAIPELTGTKGKGFAFTVYTGDLVSHDPDNQLSRAYVEYTETLLYTLFRKTLGSGPVYAALGNHDSYNQAQDAPHTLPGSLATQFQ